jgi:DNA-binding GntR family transcriptional regulator
VDAAGIDTQVLRRTDGDSAPPLYVRLAQTLAERIASGGYGVGTLLPTEAELGETFGVSRYTVRQAIQHLRQQGLVSARKGVGTRVEARRATPSYTQSMHSLSELLQFAHETRLDVTAREDVVAKGALAEELGCRPGKRWVRIEGIRHDGRGGQPICRNEVFLDAAYEGLTRDVHQLDTAIWSLIERNYGEQFVEVEQQITAVVLGPEEAGRLEAVPGAPALLFTRRYYVTGRRLVELSRSLHPADRFSYHMSIRRDLARTT